MASSIVPRQKRFEYARTSSKQDKIIDGADNSTHTTDDAVSFTVQPTDAHSTRLGPDDQSQAESESLARAGRIGLPADQLCGCDFGSILRISGFLAPRYAGGPQTTEINLDRDRSSSRNLISVRGGL